jgi:hypothetical protein
MEIIQSLVGDASFTTAKSRQRRSQKLKPKNAATLISGGIRFYERIKGIEVEGEKNRSENPHEMT